MARIPTDRQDVTPADVVVAAILPVGLEEDEPRKVEGVAAADGAKIGDLHETTARTRTKQNLARNQLVDQYTANMRRIPPIRRPTHSFYWIT